MILRDKDHLICMNPECRAESVIIKAPKQEAAPVCACGAKMKKIYNSPQLRKLSENALLVHQSNN